jgi:tagatose-6-phosphate ketose/aldose isomerase
VSNFAAEKAEDSSLAAAIARTQTTAAELLDPTEAEQRQLGYFHTLQEILQQPATWLETGKQLAALSASLRETLEGVRTLVLTGSGSSEYAGECVRLPLQAALSIPVQVIGGGALLTHGGKAIAPGRPGLMLSFARSGDSPESVGAVSLLLETEPEIRHLVLTCNKDGRVATTWRDDARVRVVVLAEPTNDRSLVMTSSFTNMVLAAASLGMLETPGKYLALTAGLSQKAEELLLHHFDALASLACRDFHRVVFLASGARIGAARESALKMMEMTAGRVWAMSETYLGLRHGPMSAVHADTLTVCCLSSDPLVRAYECDLIRELNCKQLGIARLIFGEAIPPDLARKEDVVVDIAGLAQWGDENMPVLDVILGQLLGFFRCLKEGLHPDSPSTTGVINRVVEEFTLHRPAR